MPGPPLCASPDRPQISGVTRTPLGGGGRGAPRQEGPGPTADEGDPLLRSEAEATTLRLAGRGCQKRGETASEKGGEAAALTSFFSRVLFLRCMHSLHAWPMLYFCRGGGHCTTVVHKCLVLARQTR